MRSIALLIIFVTVLGFVITKPYVGIYLFSWISYMNPHRMTWGFTYSFNFAFIAAAVTILAWLISKERKMVPMTPLILLLLLFSGWISLTTVFAMVPDAAFDRWLQVIKILAMTFLTIVLINNEKRLNILVIVVVCSVGYFGLKGGIFSILSGGSYRIYGPTGSFIEENNGLAVATLMIVPLVFYLRTLVVRPWLRMALLFSIPLLFISIVSSYSRGGFLAFLALAFFFWLKTKNKLVTGIAGALLIASIFAFMPQKYFDRISTLETYKEDTSATQRLDAWQFSWNLALANPILGGGFEDHDSLEAWELYHPESSRKGVNFHSIYFQILANHGFVGLLLYLSINVGAFLVCGKLRRRTRRIEELSWAHNLSGMLQAGLVAFAAGGAFLTLAFFDLPWHLISMCIILDEIVKGKIGARRDPATMPARVRNLDTTYEPS